MSLFLGLRQPSLTRHLGAVVLWSLITLVVLYSWNCFRENGHSAYVFREFIRHSGIVSSICALLGSVLGGIHYVLLRVLGKGAKRSFGLRELIPVIAMIVAVSALPGYGMFRHFRKLKAHEACIQYENVKDIEVLIGKGDMQSAVRRMEQACERYHEAQVKLGSDFAVLHHRNDEGGNGNGYLCNTLVLGWDSLTLNMPRSLCNYFDMEPRVTSHRDLENPEQWAPLAKEMSASTTPILRALGFWLLQDREKFVEMVYRQFDSGDFSFQALDAQVAFQIDLNSKRALHRLTRHTEAGLPVCFRTEHLATAHDLRVFELAIALMNEGQELGEDLNAVRAATKRYLSSQRFRDAYDSESERTAIEAQLLKLGFTAPPIE